MATTKRAYRQHRQTEVPKGKLQMPGVRFSSDAFWTLNLPRLRVQISQMWKELVSALNQYDIHIYTKTPVLNFDRPLEILTWLRINAHKGDKFVSIEDDCSKEEYAKYSMDKYLVHTDFFCMTEYEGGLQKYRLTAKSG